MGQCRRCTHAAPRPRTGRVVTVTPTDVCNWMEDDGMTDAALRRLRLRRRSPRQSAVENGDIPLIFTRSGGQFVTLLNGCGERGASAPPLPVHPIYPPGQTCSGATSLPVFAAARGLWSPAPRVRRCRAIAGVFGPRPTSSTISARSTTPAP